MSFSRPKLIVLMLGMLLAVTCWARQPRVSASGYLNGWYVAIPKKGAVVEPVCQSPYADSSRREIHCGEPKHEPSLGEIDGDDGVLEGYTVILGRAVICTDPSVQPKDYLIICNKVAGDKDEP